MQHKMELSIAKFQVENLNFSKIRSDEKVIGMKKTFDFHFFVNYDIHHESLFSVVFNVKLVHPEDFTLEVEYVTYFKTSESIDEEFKASTFPSVNAPAIAFPFLRSFISTLTLNAGYNPVLLPSINFSKIKKQTNKQM